MGDLQKLLDRHREAGTIPGAVALIDRPDAPLDLVTVGSASLGGPALRSDAVFRIMSMTKAVTAVATLRLIERGEFALDDDVSRWLPELADRRVLVHPDAPLHDTVPAGRPITVRHLLTNTSGYGSMMTDSPLARAMLANRTEMGPAPLELAADDWLAALAELPLAFPPGDGWRYHHSFGILGILLSRLTARPLGDHLQEDLFAPLGMVDTGFGTPDAAARRLPAAYRHDGGRLVEIEPAGGGFDAGPPPFDVSHGELVSTVADYHRFLRALRDGELVTPEQGRALASDQVPSHAKTADSFFPGFWEGMGWGYGVGVQTSGPRAGRYGWSGGLGTDFFVDADGTVAILLTQVEMGEAMMPLLTAFQDVV
ncbi:serine hydrolase domain-containing protein [Microbacterium hominis]|uniref:Beta-lactamase family protein n=1 Tax=Microbacterium hominis TaxID=162426 RepID=A0A7D4QG06_9MICO|nr:serine hydrolase domain-containing protein [Microbacterium hominis]QKJ18076.1 beta-lactamase family protein [Microbacterium hominis]